MLRIANNGEKEKSNSTTDVVNLAVPQPLKKKD